MGKLQVCHVCLSARSTGIVWNSACALVHGLWWYMYDGISKTEKTYGPPQTGPQTYTGSPSQRLCNVDFFGQEDVAEEGLEEGEHFGCSGVVGIVMDHGGWCLISMPSEIDAAAACFAQLWPFVRAEAISTNGGVFRKRAWSSRLSWTNWTPETYQKLENTENPQPFIIFE